MTIPLNKVLSFAHGQRRARGARAGNFLGIKGFAQLPLSPLLEFVARAKARGKHLPRLIGYLASRKGDPSLIALITECLAYGEPDPYTVVRSIWSLLSRAEDEQGRRVLRWLDKGIAEELFEVWKKHWEGHRAGGTPSSATTVAGTGSWT